MKRLLAARISIVRVVVALTVSTLVPVGCGDTSSQAGQRSVAAPTTTWAKAKQMDPATTLAMSDLLDAVQKAFPKGRDGWCEKAASALSAESGPSDMTKIAWTIEDPPTRDALLDLVAAIGDAIGRCGDAKVERASLEEVRSLSGVLRTRVLGEKKGGST